MSYLAALFAEPTANAIPEHLADRRLIDLEPGLDEPSYLISLSRTLADELIVENRSWLGRTVEVLANGLLLQTDCPLSAGDRVRLEMAIDTRVVEGSGEVLHVQIRPDSLRTVLFEYHEISDRGQDLLAELAAER